MLPTALIFRVPDHEEARIDDAEDVPTALLRMPQVLDWDPGCLVFGAAHLNPNPKSTPEGLNLRANSMLRKLRCSSRVWEIS